MFKEFLFGFLLAISIGSLCLVPYAILYKLDKINETIEKLELKINENKEA